VGLPDSILLSPERLSPEQFEIRKEHPIFGGDALAGAVKRLGAESFLSMGRDIAYYHHEHWDGSGYPFGLKGQAIPHVCPYSSHNRRVRRLDHPDTLQKDL
jgi:putative two-component system response regulator